jgi:hypothetical protein
MVKVLLFLGGLSILLVSSRQAFLMFRGGSFRARGNRLIVRNAHPIIFWMNFVGLVLFGVVGVALILLAIAYLMRLALSATAVLTPIEMSLRG